MLNINTFLFIKITATQDSKLWIQGKSKTAIQVAASRVAEFSTSLNTNFYSSVAITQSNHHTSTSYQWSMPHMVTAKPGLGKKIRECFVQSLPMCGVPSPVEENTQLWGVWKHPTTCCNRKFQLNLTPVINIRFIIHKEP